MIGRSVQHAAPTRRPRAFAAAVALALVGGLLTAVGAAATATAAPATAAASATGDGVHWGFKASWRTYIATLAGDGVVTTVSPAVFEDADGVSGAARPYRFPATATRAGADYVVTGAGGVDYLAHAGALDFVVSKPTIVTSGTSGHVVVDYVDADGPHKRVTIATIGTLAVDASTTGYVSITGTDVTTTEAGNTMFGGFYPAGTALDDITASAAIVAAKATATAQLTLKKTKVKQGKRAKVKVKVSARGVTPTGKVVIKERGTKLTTVQLAKGKAKAKLPKLSKGKHKLRAVYRGSARVAAAKSATTTLRVV